MVKINRKNENCQILKLKKLGPISKIIMEKMANYSKI